MLVLATRQGLCARERFRKTHLEELEIVVGDALPDTLEGRWGAGAARDGHLGAVATEDEALFFHDPQPLRDGVVQQSVRVRTRTQSGYNTHVDFKPDVGVLIGGLEWPVALREAHPQGIAEEGQHVHPDWEHLRRPVRE